MSITPKIVAVSVLLSVLLTFFAWWKMIVIPIIVVLLFLAVLFVGKLWGQPLQPQKLSVRKPKFDIGAVDVSVISGSEAARVQRSRHSPGWIAGG